MIYCKFIVRHNAYLHTPNVRIDATFGIVAPSRELAESALRLKLEGLGLEIQTTETHDVHLVVQMT